MIRVKNVEKVGMCGNLTEVKFEFEFDNASTLPVKTYILGNTTYLIANNSIAINIVTNISYNYNEGIWTKVLSKSTIPQSNLTNVFIKNGNYDVVNNELKGISGIEVMVGSPDTKLIDKTIIANNTYNAEDDNANGYSSVTVDVPNTYTAGDEGKVVNNGALVSQTSTSATTNGIVDTTLNNSIDINVPNTYTVNDNGKVVNNQELVAQTAYPDTVTTNNTYDTTNYNSITVDVANTYTNEDEGKVVDNGELIAQTAYATEITENDTYDTTLYNSITVNVPSSGSSGSMNDDVVFYDYDGSVVTSYSATDFANLTAMPANPTHEGLTAQGWNWSLADAKAYVASYGKLNIGQMYITNDGKTRLYFTVTKSNQYPALYLDLESDTELDVDWGDGSEHTRWTSVDGDSAKSHDYSSAGAGRYVIVITVITGEFSLSSAVSNTYKVEIGNGVIGIDAFTNCYALSSITIPNSVTSIGNSAFTSCYALSSVTIPNSVTSIDVDAFSYCYVLSSITIPNSVTSIGDNAFYECYALSSVTIPNSVTSIGEQVFYYCYALSSITIPNSVTSIDGSAFYYCYALSSVTIPNSVTSIGDNAFDSCYALLSVTFESSTPPNIDGSFPISDACIIRVPQGSLELYTEAQNYPDPSEYIYEEY